MKPILSDKSIVAILFALVLVSFSLANEDSKKAEKMYSTTAGIVIGSKLTASAPIELPAPLHSPTEASY